MSENCTGYLSLLNKQKPICSFPLNIIVYHQIAFSRQLHSAIKYLIVEIIRYWFNPYYIWIYTICLLSYGLFNAVSSIPDESEIIRKETARASFEVLSRKLLGGTEFGQRFEPITSWIQIISLDQLARLIRAMFAVHVYYKAMKSNTACNLKSFSRILRIVMYNACQIQAVWSPRAYTSIFGVPLLVVAICAESHSIRVCMGFERTGDRNKWRTLDIGVLMS
jgi:hypothetical protein